jgi:hypothetical protein
MTVFVWFLGAITHPFTHRGYLPVGMNSPDADAIFATYRKLDWRAEQGQLIDPAEFPTAFERSSPKTNGKLNLPLWYSTYRLVRADMVAVIRRFDLGNTVLVPVTISLPDDDALNGDYMILSVANIRVTINDALSERLRAGHKRRAHLWSDKPVHPGVVARADALAGPDIWQDPGVASTIFVSDRLAKALLAEEFGKELKLRKIRIEP